MTHGHLGRVEWGGRDVRGTIICGHENDEVSE